VEVDLSELDFESRTADGRGRVTLGSEYANMDVKVAIIEDSASEAGE